MAIVTAQAELPKSAPVQPQAPRQENTVETPAVEAPKAGEAGDFLTPKFAALAREQKKIRAAQAKFNAEREAFEAEKSKYNSDYIPKSKLKEEAMAALRNGQLSYDEFTQAMLNAPEARDPTIVALEAKIAELEGKVTKTSTDMEEGKSREYTQAVNQIRNDVKSMVASDSNYETIKDLGQEEAVVALIEDNFNANGTILSIEEAAKEVEDYLVEEALRMAGLNKIKAKLNPPAPVVETKQQSQQQQQIKTLTHAVSASSSSSGLSARERRERAIAAFKGQLK